MTDDADGGSSLLAWWVVADVGSWATHLREDGAVRVGLRLFPPGARLWVVPPPGGDDEDVLVVGRHREASGRDYVRTSVPRRHLTGFRVRGVYSPAVLRRLMEPATLGSPQSRLWESRDEAERVAARWNEESTR